MEILARADSGGVTHDFVTALRDLEIRFSISFDLTEPVRDAILAMPEGAWAAAVTQAGEEREDAAVCELTNLDLGAWPEGTCAICRRERPHPGAQLTFTDHHGFRFPVFITDQDDADLAQLEARHRGRAHVEDRIRCGKDTGLCNFPFRQFAANQVWLELVLAVQDLLTFFSSSASAWMARRAGGSPSVSAIDSSTSPAAWHAADAACFSFTALLALGGAARRRVSAASLPARSLSSS